MSASVGGIRLPIRSGSPNSALVSPVEYDFTHQANNQLDKLTHIMELFEAAVFILGY
jgi:hypothetical protein